MKTSIPERPTDPRLAELHDLAIIIQERNENRTWLQRYTWLFYGLSFILIFAPGDIGTLAWAGALLIAVGITIATIIYQMKTNKYRIELYDKSAVIRRQSSLQVIDRLKTTLPEKDVRITPEGHIVMSDKESQE